MRINKIALQNFRNFPQAFFEFDQINLLLGKNGSGKTSVMEAIYSLSSGNSFRAGQVEEMIGLGHDLARVKGEVVVEKNGDNWGQNVENLLEGKNVDDDLVGEEKIILETMFTNGFVQGKKTQKRHFSVNGAKRRQKDFLKNFFAVVFRPEDMRLIEGSPNRRRVFLNTALQELDYEYANSLSSYEQTLRRRNRLLDEVREAKQSRASLTYWNLALVKHGQILQHKRQDFLNFVQTVAFPMDFSIDYQPSLITAERAEQYLDKEIMVGHSLIGPHKDDFSVCFRLSYFEKLTNKKLDIQDDLALSSYGSRGQQRMGVLWLKLGELEFIKRRTGLLPVIILDDIFSELDEVGRKMVMGLVKDHQSFFTTADQSSADELLSGIENVKRFIL
ncbi:MAG: DNA replication/repair protein RecF [Patescibacteria group bacterium]